MIRKFKVYYIDLDMGNAEYGSDYKIISGINDNRNPFLG